MGGKTRTNLPKTSLVKIHSCHDQLAI
jgi:hypothetical protein